jgi:protein-ribulosamine 3-kinase
VDGEEKEYFLKASALLKTIHKYFDWQLLSFQIIERSEWSGMAEAEYESQKALSVVIPDNVVAPLAWGIFEKDKSKSFFITRFRNLRDRSPPPLQFLPILKRLHQTSVSPTGKFGFHCTTYNGPPVMVNDWTDSWEEYYARQFRSDISYLQGVYGKDTELNDLTEEFIQKVVARLLRPLQTGGRNIKPALCHGDLWDGNLQIDVDTKQPITFDSCAFYGHNEGEALLINLQKNLGWCQLITVDLQSMGDSRYILGMDFIDMYKNEVGASKPQKDFYDRHELYAM